MITIFGHADPSELKNIQALARKTVDQSYRYFLGDEIVELYLSSGRLEEYLRLNIHSTWCLYQHDALLGFSICIDNVIDFMMVDFNNHRQGLGTKLLQHSEDLLFKNYDVIALESYEKNTKANLFFESKKWIPTEKYKDHKAHAMKIIFRKYSDSYVENS